MKQEKETKVEEVAKEAQEVKQEAQEVENQAAEEVNEWEKKYKDLNDSHLRLMADFDNYRKRTIKEKADLIKNAGERIITDFLPIVDNFERALESMKTAEDVDAVRQGVELIYNQVMSMLKSNGVAVIETENAPFDTEFHEAITTIPAPTPELKDKIVDCTTKGYTMNEKVIRHSKVVVGA
ncbi:MAG: nucleotide exchange factor GrpE [Paludibacteraceae bacterium]|nr:nucleotide exchange factor GrpE [Paludibacteraceae bacterium]